MATSPSQRNFPLATHVTLLEGLGVLASALPHVLLSLPTISQREGDKEHPHVRQGSAEREVREVLESHRRTEADPAFGAP